MCFLNLYAPNKDDPDFFQRVFDKVFELEGNKIIAGDFNTVLDAKHDRVTVSDKAFNNSKAADYINGFLEQNCFQDIWRVRNPLTHQYTWSRSRPNFVGSRLDYFLIETGISAWVDEVKIGTGIKTDHRPVKIKISPYGIARGPGVWKLNTKLLTNSEYVQKINEVINKALEWSPNLDPQNRWDSVKMIVIAESQEFSRLVASRNRQTAQHLETIVEDLESKLALSANETDLLLLEKTKSELEQFYESKRQGAIFRSRVRWYNEGEKNSKYFLNLEKCRSASKGMSCASTENGTIVNPIYILQEQELFYTTLYAKDENVVFDASDIEQVPQVLEKHFERLEGHITLEEMESAVKHMARNKTPGGDGLPVEWYIVFWNQVKNLLKDAINAGYENGQLHKSALEGIITLIPKKDKDVRKIENMRPITLLNVDYKIIEKVLADRIKPSLYDIIHPNQKGFLKGRHISINIQKILDLLDYTHENNIPGVILSIDWSKAFDRCEINSVLGALEKFGYPPQYVKWIKTVYTGPNSKVVNKGFLSNSINIERSVKQGGPNSAFLFLVIAELFAISLRQNKQITGFPIKEIMDLLGQFADDTDLFLNATERNIRNALSIVDNFYHISGMKVNYDKTTLYRIGSLNQSDAQMYVEQQVNWKSDEINVLGVCVTYDKSALLEKNYGILLTKTENILKSWKSRNLSLNGKIIVINSLIASLFVYKMSVLPSLTDAYVEKFNKIILDFIWNGRKAKISYDKLCNVKQFGGLKLVNLRIKDRAHKAIWVKTVSEDPYMRELAFNRLKCNMYEHIFRANLSKKDIELNFPDCFWRDVLVAWFEYAFETHPSGSQIFAQSIWYNSHIKSGGSIMKNNDALDNRLRTIWDIFCFEDKRFMSAKEIAEKYQINIMLANSILTAIPAQWKVDCKKLSCFPSVRLYDEFIREKNLVKKYYESQVKNQMLLFETYAKWQAKVQSELSYAQFLKLFTNIYKITNYTKLRAFQYRLLNNSLVTNRMLKIWGITGDDTCSFCKTDVETTTHIMWTCPKVQAIWYGVKQIITNICPEGDPFDLSLEKVIFNNVTKNPTHVYNFIVLAVKQKIYAEKCLGNVLRIQVFEKYLKECQQIEKYNVIQTGNVAKHTKKWQGIATKVSKEHEKCFNSDIFNVEEYAEQYIIQNEFFSI